MGLEYDNYLREHIGAVRKSWDWMQDHIIQDEDLNKFLVSLYGEAHPADIFEISELVQYHDSSKTAPDEYYPYDNYFYIQKDNRSSAVVDNFNRAFLLHMHRNPHHWQFWVLTDDNKGDGVKLIEMPLNYIFEMICDWWSFSWRENDLFTIFDWWDKHKEWIRLHKRSRKAVDKILETMKKTLEEEYKKPEEENKEESIEHTDKDDKDKKFGVPEENKFPMPDAAHVKSAIKFFNYVDPKYEEELAKAILARMKEYGMSFEDFGVGDENKFKKYIPKKNQD